jgi:hypothetical protein
VVGCNCDVDSATIVVGNHICGHKYIGIIYRRCSIHSLLQPLAQDDTSVRGQRTVESLGDVGKESSARRPKEMLIKERLKEML